MNNPILNVANLMRDKLLGPRKPGAADTGSLVGAPSVGRPKLSEAEKAEATLATDRPQPRPYHSAHLPPVEFFETLWQQVEAPEITPMEREKLRAIQKRARRLYNKIHRLTVDGILAEARAARKRLRKGHGSTSDSDFAKGNLIEVRKTLKRELREQREKAVPILVGIAERAQERAHRALPQFEADASCLGLFPGAVPAVQLCAAATTAPAHLAASGLHAPAQFLKKLGIQL